MKKRNIVFIIISLFIVVFGIVFYISKAKTIESFNLMEYNVQIEKFSSDKNVGKIDSSKNVIEKVKKLWREEKLYEKAEWTYNPLNGRSIKIYFDDENDCWLAMGTLPSNWVGVVPKAILKNDGTVLAVWFE